ncbi:MAG: discoidin domain-containing protein, partial [Planctomycetota bacterium]
MVLVLAVCPAGVAPLYGDDIIWDFENGNDHGFTLWSVRPATPAPDDPSTAGDEAVTGVGGPSGLPDAGVAWSVGRPDQYDGQKPAVNEGDKARADGTMEYNQPGTNHPFGFPVNNRGQESYLNTYNLTGWGDNVHTNTNDQIATSPLVLLGDNAVLTVWTAGANNNYHAPELDPNPAEGYTTNSCGIAIISQVDGSLLDSVFTPSTGGSVNEYTIDLTAFAGQRVYVEVVDAYAGSWGWIAVDEIRITNAKALIAPPTNASAPSPADEVIDVPVEVVLSWTPGELAPAVNGHAVYFGESFSDVNDGTGGITQDANTYNPGRLNMGTTYYWRVDEVNAPPDSTVFKGAVWSFTTEPIGYPIDGVNIIATASSSGEVGFGPEKTIDGSGLDDNGLHSTEPLDMWLSGSEPLGAWIQYEFNRVHKLHEMWVWNSNQIFEGLFGFGMKDVTLEYSTNGTEWTALAGVPEFAKAPGAVGYAHDTTVDFGGAVAKFVRLTATTNWGGLLPQYGLSEVRFFSIPVSAREPSPDSGATDVDPDVTLAWRAGREAATHNVYLSTDQQAVIDGTAPAVSVADASYSSALDLGSTYFWRIDEVNDAETPTMWEGDVWNFSTPEYIVVDGFE